MQLRALVARFAYPTLRRFDLSVWSALSLVVACESANLSASDCETCRAEDRENAAAEVGSGGSGGSASAGAGRGGVTAGAGGRDARTNRANRGGAGAAGGGGAVGAGAGGGAAGAGAGGAAHSGGRNAAGVGAAAASGGLDAGGATANTLAQVADGLFAYAGLRVAPRVVFASEPTQLHAYGAAVESARGKSATLDGSAIGDLTALTAVHATLPLPALTAGAHTLKIAGQPDITLTAIVRKTYTDADIPLPGSALQFVHDVARDMFFVITSKEPGQSSQLIRIAGEPWKVDTIAIDAPLGIALTQDGAELLVSTRPCNLQRVHPDTLTVSPTVQLIPDCSYTRLGAIGPLADGRTLLANTDPWSMLWNYPGLQVVNAPSVYSPAFAISGDGTRMLWAEGAANSGQARIYRLDAGTTEFKEFSLLGDNYFLRHMAVSRDHKRFLHGHDIYDDAFQYLGGLDATYPTPWTVGLSGDGKVALSYNLNTQSVHAFDVSAASGPFPTLGEVIRWTDETAINLLHVDDVGATAFMFFTGPGATAAGLLRVRGISRK